MITIEQMLLRKRVLQQSAKRHRPRKLAPAKPPTGLMLEYTRMLMELSREMDSAVFASLTENRVVRMDDDLPPLPSSVRRVMQIIANRLSQIASRRSLIGQILSLAQRVGDFTKAQWQRELQAALGVDLRGAVGDIDLTQLVNTFRTTNLDLISSLAQDKVERVRTVLETPGPTRRVEDIALDIREQTGATDSRAALIARDQVLTLNSQIMQARHEAAGITQYVWSTSHDQRVRPSHKLLEGKQFSYAAPPVVDEDTGRRANPGQDIQCRCIAAPVIPGIPN